MLANILAIAGTNGIIELGCNLYASNNFIIVITKQQGEKMGITRPKLLLLNLGVTQDQIAEKAGVTQGYISRCVNLQHSVSEKVRKATEELCGVDPWDGGQNG